MRFKIMEENKIIEKINNDRCYTVYMHTSPSGKRYIGITSQKPERRWGNNGSYYQNKHLRSAIAKYGWENFKHEILFEKLTKQEAEEKEIELIAKYQSNNREFGYNIENGGNSTGCFSEETKRMLSKIHKTIDKDWVRIPICQYTTEGVLIKEWKSSIHAEKALGIEHTSIRCCCRGDVKISGGYIWKNKGDVLTEEEVVWRNTSNRYSPNKKEISQYDKNGKFIKKYDSILSASKELGIEHAVISRCCNDTQRIAGGYIWRYSDVELTIEHLKWCNETSERPTIRRAVSQYSKDGNLLKQYESIATASLETGILSGSISVCCSGNGRQKTAGGYIWRYTDG